MNQATPTTARKRASKGGTALSAANLLTYARIAAVPAVAACLFGIAVLDGGLWLRWLALAIYFAAAVTDWLDGWVARTYSQFSRLGRMLDPIADKLLVSSCLLMLAADGTIKGWVLWAAIIILCREILVSGLREYLAELHVSVPVSKLAKWKTMMQLVAVGFLIAGDAGNDLLQFVALELITRIGTVLLWISAILTLYTGYDYFRAGSKHLVE